MSLAAILLLIVSAFLHAGWNLLSKRNNPSPSFLLVANAFGCLILLPAVCLWGKAYLFFPLRVWILVMLTGVCMAVYYAALALAYREGDMSIVYPLARSSPLIVVTVTALLLGRKSEVGNACIAGIVLIVGGCFLLPMNRFRDLRLRNYTNAACLFALLAAFGTAGYSMLDDTALRCLRASSDVGLKTVPATMLYSFVEALSASLWLGGFVLGSRRGRRELGAVWRHQRSSAFLAGAGIYVTYTIVLVSLAFVRNVSYVVAFRQLSIPIGAVLGMLLLKEPRPAPKIAGIAVLFVGLLMVGLG